jgi:hypothetical protein
MEKRPVRIFSRVCRNPFRSDPVSAMAASFPEERDHPPAGINPAECTVIITGAKRGVKPLKLARKGKPM